MTSKQPQRDLHDAKFEPDASTYGCSPWQLDQNDKSCRLKLQAHCQFGPEIFEQVMLNLIKNPNVTSSHLFRADIFYDSLNDINYDPLSDKLSSYIAHMRKEYRPLSFHLPTFKLKRTIVRQLIPRNPQRDAALVQTCHILQRLPLESSEATVETIVVYLPHASSAAEIPYYHPPVEAVLFQHSSKDIGHSRVGSTLKLHMSYFTADQDLSTASSDRIDRTSLNLLRTIWKHGQGELAGYVKRVQHDVLIPQKRVQDTYTLLKSKYAKGLLMDWRETTDPTKHVFEDLGIAAFLIELWSDMYREAQFPGFVDIGCGNGVLVNLLKQEGYDGWGFDARKRKSWESYSRDVQDSLKEMILIPSVFEEQGHLNNDGDTGRTKVHVTPDEPSGATSKGSSIHHGLFPKDIFIISNHADELTPWTPLLGYLSDCPFICIPCCSHDLSGARFRAPAKASSQNVKPDNTAKASDEPAQPDRDCLGTTSSSDPQAISKECTNPKSGSLAIDRSEPKQLSAYASLCRYVTYLTEKVGIVAEKEMLRIPSTRNEAIIGRTQRESETEKLEFLDRESTVRQIVEHELGQNIHTAGQAWRERAQALASKTGSAGH